MATALLYAEARMGELLKDTELSKGGQFSKSTGCTDATSTLKDLGIEKTESHRAQTLANHKDVIEQVIDEAIENEDIPTKTAAIW